jgi:hypothetical protein
MMKKSQTATEYLIILAVIIVIALIVVGLLGGIPGIGGGSNKRTNDARIGNLDIGVSAYTVTSSNAILALRNNYPEIMDVTNITINGTSCEATPAFPIPISTGETVQVICTSALNGPTSGTNYNFEFNITRKDTLGSSYTDSGRLIGKVANAPTP